MNLPYDQAARLVRDVQLEEFRALLASESLTRAGLLRLRARLASGEFPRPDAAVDLVQLDVDQALADLVGVDREDLPGAVQVPVSLEGLPDGL